MKVQRVEVDDVIFRDGTAAVLVHGTLVLLSEIGAMIFAQTAQPVDVAQLARHLESTFGAPTGHTALEATHAAIEALGPLLMTVVDGEPQ